MKKCIIAPDSFKGSLSATKICDIVEKSILKFFPGCEVIKLPIADGGEGTADCMLAARKGEKVYVAANDPYMRKIDTYYARFSDVAVVEMAKAAGLPLLGNDLNPLKASTYGVGELVLHALRGGAKKILIGLGGSSTNDGACGMVAALGARFFDKEGREFVPTGGTLKDIAKVDLSELRANIGDCEIVAMSDIDNPMYGERGAAYIFSPQKGANDEMVKFLDENLIALSEIMKKELGKDVANVPGSGAAGAMGAGILAFLDGKLRSGIEAVLDMVEFDKELIGADVVITGEGRIDSQSVGGKAISGVAGRASKKGVPVYVFAGQIGDGAEAAYDIGVTAMFSINRKAETFEMSKDKSEENLRATIEDFLRVIKQNSKQ